LARRNMPQPRCAAPAKVDTVDLVGDGGVIKTVLAAGAGARPTRGAMVEVHYVGRLVETGAVFDSSRARGKTFKFSLGEGKVIGGWEVGVSSMQVGELSEITCSPQYAYGAKGIPPMIPPRPKAAHYSTEMSTSDSSL
jgi:FKBP-type peptidyl-prolyl cis-trans isomerase